jgi:hypothetical protein
LARLHHHRALEARAFASRLKLTAAGETLDRLFGD